MLRRTSALVVLFGLSFLSLLPVYKFEAQVSTGTIGGTVKDSTGAAIPGAQVVAGSIETGQPRSVITDSIGSYTIPDLQAGHYSLTVSHGGFKTTTVANIELQVAQRAVLDPVLEVGNVSEKVTVTTMTAPLLNTVTSSVGQVVDTKTVATMPLNGRNFWQLTQLTPGVSYINAGQNPATGGTSIRAAVVNVNVNGLSPTWTGWFLDGANITEFQAGGTIIQPNVDALQEFKVEGGNMPAEYGHTPTIINASLKSGSNAFHGTAYEYFRNNVLDAKNYFFLPAAGSHQRDEPLHRNQFGVNIGGPIRHDKIFFFVDAESTLFRLGEDFNNVVPSMAERGGDFSQSSTVIVNPATGKPFPGNVIPQGLITPRPNSFSSTCRCLTLSPARSIARSTPTPSSSNWIRATSGWIIRSQPLITSWAATRSPTIAKQIPIRTLPWEAFPCAAAVKTRKCDGPISLIPNGSMKRRFPTTEATSFSPAPFKVKTSMMRLESRAWTGWLRTNTWVSRHHHRQLLNLHRGFHQLLPKVKPASLLAIRGPGYPVVGKHDMRFGFEWYHNNLEYISGSNSVGSFTFNGLYTKDNFADFLLGYAKSATRSYFRNIWGSIGNFQSYYFQDDYRFFPNLTFNLGIRWEVNPFYNGLNGQTTGFDQASGNLIIPSNFSLEAQPQTATFYPLFQDRIELTGRRACLPRYGRPMTMTSRRALVLPGTRERASGSCVPGTVSSLVIPTITISTTRRILFLLLLRRL